MIIQGSFNLASWKNLTIEGVRFNLIDLIKNSHVAQIIITNPFQVKLLNRCWQLVHILHWLFKYDTLQEGFINLKFCTIPPAFGPCPDNALYHIKITLFLREVINKKDSWQHKYAIIIQGWITMTSRKDWKWSNRWIRRFSYKDALPKCGQNLALNIIQSPCNHKP